MARLLLFVLLSGGVSAFFTPPKGVVPSADDTDAATPDRMVYAFGVSLATSDVLKSLWRNSWCAQKFPRPCSRIAALTRRSFARRGNLVASSYTIGEMPDPKAPNGMQPGRVVDYVRNANLDAGIAYVSASGYTFSDNTRHEVDNEAWYQDERVRSKTEITDTMWKDVRLLPIDKMAVVRLHQIHFALCSKVLGTSWDAAYAAGNSMLSGSGTSTVMHWLNDETKGCGCTIGPNRIDGGTGTCGDNCHPDEFEWATDRAAEHYMKANPTFDRNSVLNFMLACSHEMGYSSILPPQV